VNSLFLGDNESGTAQELIDTNARLINCTFAHNTRGNFRGLIKILKFWRLCHKSIIQKVYAYVGEAMIVNHHNNIIAIVSINFEENSAEIGGAMLLHLEAILLISIAGLLILVIMVHFSCEVLWVT
jgi:hypothetical protein